MSFQSGCINYLKNCCKILIWKLFCKWSFAICFEILCLQTFWGNSFFSQIVWKSNVWRLFWKLFVSKFFVKYFSGNCLETVLLKSLVLFFFWKHFVDDKSLHSYHLHPFRGAGRWVWTLYWPLVTVDYR